MRAISLIPFCILSVCVLCSGQCTKDTDCKGDRICVDGVCVSPADRTETVAPPSSSKKGAQMGKGSFYLNPLGVLQFGPLLGFEIGTGGNAFIDLHWRYSAIGLVYAAVLTEGFNDYMSMGSMAFGGGFRYFFSSSRPHRAYIGALAEYGWGRTWGEDEYDQDVYRESAPDAWQGEEAQIVFIGNGGYRWRFGPAFFFNAGGLAGVAIDVKDEIVYKNKTPRETKDYAGATPFGMLEFAVGWEFRR
ncbi:MAG: hypothetical protein GF350_14160 [Chitinivibrionales bacterium]|nr:hypothetical protein [Chitinivibrionales bacterium]